MSGAGPQVGSTFLTYPAPDGEWVERAGCQGMAPAFDGPLPGEKAEETALRVKSSLAVCRRGCPVRAECQAWTEAQPRWKRVGVMGGKFWTPVHHPVRKRTP